MRAPAEEVVTGSPEMAFVTASSAARSREVLCGGAAPHDDNTTETATARSGRWKLNMSAPGQDALSLPAPVSPHKTNELRKTCGRRQRLVSVAVRRFRETRQTIPLVTSDARSHRQGLGRPSSARCSAGCSHPYLRQKSRSGSVARSDCSAVRSDCESRRAGSRWCAAVLESASRTAALA